MSMQLTRAGEYAVKSLVYLAKQGPNARVMASEVAIAEDIPINFVRKILESLAKTGLIKSYRGAGGGFTLGRTADQITVQHVVEAVEGPISLNQCLSPSSCVNKGDCAMGEIWQEAQTAVEGVLSRYSLADVVQLVAKPSRSLQHD